MLTASARRPARRSILDAWLARWGILDWLRVVWCTSVLWYEFLSFAWSLRACPWPDNGLSVAQERPAHVLIVADPHVRDLSTSKVARFAAINQYLVDFSLKRNWFFASRKGPDLVVFLGDILASWRVIRSDDEYERNYDKFLDVFHIDRRVPSYYVPGNNDVGLNIEQGAARQARHRFTTHFGPLNQKIVVRNHTLVMLDAAGLVEEDYLRAAKYIDYDHWAPLPHGPVEFVHHLQEDRANSTILFSHIPLHRPDTASCGPLREGGSIHRGVGPSYQNTLGKKTTAFLLHEVSPQLVFSADDKDYCDYVHVPPKYVTADPTAPAQANRVSASKPQNVREVTVKAFSPSSEIRYPGFQLLSLVSPSSSSQHPSLATAPCFLPDYPAVYSWRYLPLFLLTTFVIVFLRRRKLRAQSLPTHLKHSSLRESFSLNSLPTAPWSPRPHPLTPFAPDWAPHTPGFHTPRPRSPHSPKSPESPEQEIHPDFLRTPAPTSQSAVGLPTTPTFRATMLPRTDDEHLPTGPAHLDVEELDDEFAYGRYDQRQPLRMQLERPEDDASGGVDEFALTFTLYGRRRRVPLWIPLLTGWGKTRGFGAARKRTKRAFVKRVGMDLLYILWPAVALWMFLAWLVS